MKLDWLEDRLEEDPSALANEVLEEAPDWRCVITASTKDLQAFLLKHADTAEVWEESLDMVRMDA